MKRILSGKLLACLIALLVSVTSVTAQKNEFNNVKYFSMQNLRPIIENSSVKGYYVYTYSKKVKKKKEKEVEYNLTLLDNELNVTNTIKITRPRAYRLLESSYNGKAFCFLYMDTKKKTLEYLILDDSGNDLGKYKVNKVSFTELNYIASMTATNEDTYSGGITAVSDTGFVRYGWEREKGKGKGKRGKTSRASIEMFDNNGTKLWEGHSAEKGDVFYESMVPFYSDSKAIVSFVQVKEKMFKGAMKSYLIWHNALTGEVMFVMDTNGKTNHPTTTEKVKPKGKEKQGKTNTLLPLTVTYDATTDEYYVCGEYYKFGDNMLKVKSQGFFMNSISSDGELKQEGYTSWEKDIKKYLPKKDDAYERNITIHKVVRTADGKIFAIGEQFKKKFNGWAIPMYMLEQLSSQLPVHFESNTGLAKLVIYDMVILEFDKELKLNEVHTFKKDRKNVPLPKGTGIYGPTLLGNYVKAMGGFDYEFTSVSDDQKTFSTGYVNFTKKRRDGRGYKAGSINYTSSQVFAEDRVPFAKKAMYFKAMPAKPGQVTMVEYFRKGKRVELHTEQTGM